MALQFNGGPFAGSYTTNTFNAGRAQPMPPPSQGTPYGGNVFQGNLGRQPAGPIFHGIYAPGTDITKLQFTDTMQPNPAYRPQVTPYQPFVNQQGQQFQGTMSFEPGTSQAYQNQAYGNYANQQGYYQPRVSQGAYRPATARMKPGR